MPRFSKLSSKGLLVGFFLVCSAPYVSAQTQSGPVSPYVVTGAEVPVSEVPAMKGRWTNSLGNSANAFRIENGKLFLWNGSKCGEAELQIEKVFKGDGQITIEAGPPADVIRCGLPNGMTYVYDVASKKGQYFIRGSKTDRSIQHYGTIEIQ